MRQLLGFRFRVQGLGFRVQGLFARRSSVQIRLNG